jgi:hypothetical protein
MGDGRWVALLATPRSTLWTVVTALVMRRSTLAPRAFTRGQPRSSWGQSVGTGSPSGPGGERAVDRSSNWLAAGHPRGSSRLSGAATSASSASANGPGRPSCDLWVMSGPDAVSSIPSSSIRTQETALSSFVPYCRPGPVRRGHRFGHGLWASTEFRSADFGQGSVVVPDFSFEA